MLSALHVHVQLRDFTVETWFFANRLLPLREDEQLDELLDEQPDEQEEQLAAAMNEMQLQVCHVFAPAPQCSATRTLACSLRL